MNRTCLLATALVLCTAGAAARADFFFSTPNNLGPPVNTVYGEAIGSISPDGLTLYLCDGGPFPRRPGGYGGGDIWVTTRTTLDSPWREPQNLGHPVNTAIADGLPSISADGLSLYFVRASGPGEEDIYVTTRPSLDAPWTEPVYLGNDVNSEYYDYFPYISVDGLTLYFCSHRSGNGDIYMATRTKLDEAFGIPEPIGPSINTAHAEENCPWVSADGRALFFTAKGDIFISRRASKTDPWGEPANLGLPVSTPGGESGTSLTADGTRFFFHGGHSGAGFGSVDIWEAEVHPIVDLNRDGFVDATDMCIIVDNWGTDNSLCDVGPMPWGDGTVDVQDLVVCAEHLFEEFPKRSQVTTVVIVRHAERANGTLTEDGEKRAETLARLLSYSGVSAIFSTNFTRTIETANNTAERLGIAIQFYTSVQQVADLIKTEYEGKVVLVVGHSNTVSPTIEALGVIPAPQIDGEYDNLFIITIRPDGTASSSHLKYYIDCDLY